MNLQKFAVAAVFTVFAAGATSVAASSIVSGSVVTTGAPVTLEAKKKCKRGYFYSSYRKRCVKKRRRTQSSGSF